MPPPARHHHRQLTVKPCCRIWPWWWCVRVCVCGGGISRAALLHQVTGRRKDHLRRSAQDSSRGDVLGEGGDWGGAEDSTSASKSGPEASQPTAFSPGPLGSLRADRTPHRRFCWELHCPSGPGPSLSSRDASPAPQHPAEGEGEATTLSPECRCGTSQWGSGSVFQ